MTPERPDQAPDWLNGVSNAMELLRELGATELEITGYGKPVVNLPESSVLRTMHDSRMEDLLELSRTPLSPVLSERGFQQSERGRLLEEIALSQRFISLHTQLVECGVQAEEAAALARNTVKTQLILARGQSSEQLKAYGLLGELEQAARSDFQAGVFS